MIPGGKHYVIHPSRNDEFKLWGLGDFHIGARGVDFGLLKSDIEKIRNDPRSIWVGLGDYADMIDVTDPRFSAADIHDSIMVQDLADMGRFMAGKVRDLLSPIKDKCVGMLRGNHELKFEKRHMQDVHGWLCHELGVPSFGYSCLFKLIFIRRPGEIGLTRAKQPRKYNAAAFDIFCHHGAGAATTPGGKVNRLKKFMEAYGADIYMMGHCHERMGYVKTTISTDKSAENLVSRESAGLASGTYLNAHSESNDPNYGEKAGYPPVKLGAAFVTIKPEGRRLSVTI